MKCRCDAELLVISGTVVADAMFYKAGPRTVQRPRFDANHHLPRVVLGFLI
jgi:hypothetical protein